MSNLRGQATPNADHLLPQGTVAVVTGAGRGIGLAIAKALGHHGARIALVDVNREALDSAMAALGALGVTATAVAADVSLPADADRVAGEVIDAYKRVDILVNNAGVQPRRRVRLEDIDDADWDHVIDVNLKGCFLVTRAFLPHMRRAAAGVIINIASVQGLQASPGVAAYAASKAGMLALTRNAALEYAPFGIRVMAICPGVVDTEMLAEVEPAGHEAARERLGRLHPLGRVADPMDVADVVVLLASPLARFVTGDYVSVDGGLMAKGAWARPIEGPGGDSESDGDGNR